MKEASVYTGLGIRVLRNLYYKGILQKYRPQGTHKILFDVVDLDNLIQRGKEEVPKLA